MDERITIIEGPPPTFEHVNDGWALGLSESPFLYEMMVTRLRTFNGPALVERCNRVWNQKSSIFLHYRDSMGIEETAPIFAARSMDSEDGQLLELWVRLEPEEVELKFDYEDDDDEEYEG